MGKGAGFGFSGNLAWAVTGLPLPTAATGGFTAFCALPFWAMIFLRTDWG